MKVTKQSVITKNVSTREMDVTEEQLARHRNGANVQDVFPHLSVDDREFIVSGVTPEEWAAAFPPGEED
jgi:hypothetical protein